MYSILDLFSGIGGFSLGLHSASDKFYTTAFCEIEEFCQAVLKKNFKNTPIFSDIKELNEKTLKAAGAVKPFIITGGYPCQPFSVAGKRKGKDDPRNLWSEMFRLIKELKPVWVLAENVEGHIKLGLDKVLYDLESQNYTTQTFIIPATGVGANHQRKRLWIMGYSQHNGSLAAKEQRSINTTGNNNKKRKNKTIKFERTSLRRNSKIMENPNTTRCKNKYQQHQRKQTQNKKRFNSISRSNIIPNTKSFRHRGRKSKECNMREWEILQKEQKGDKMGSKIERCDRKVGDNWNIEPNVGRVANGISFRVDRLKAIGNSIVPQIAEIIGKAIISHEEQKWNKNTEK